MVQLADGKTQRVEFVGKVDRVSNKKDQENQNQNQQKQQGQDQQNQNQQQNQQDRNQVQFQGLEICFDF